MHTTFSDSNSQMKQAKKELPYRGKTHVIETLSRTLLLRALPPEWICREVLERDYGIDLYIEMIGESGLLTGHIVAVQLKARQNIRWRGKNQNDVSNWFLLTGIPKTTIKYWMALQVPVFLFLVELSSKKVFYAAVKRQVRQRYGRFQKYNSFGFRFFRISDLTTTVGQDTLQQEYLLERGYERFTFRMFDIVAHYPRYIELFRKAEKITHDIIVSPYDWATSSHLAQSCITILEHFGENSRVRRLKLAWSKLPKVHILSDPKANGKLYIDTLRPLYSVFTHCLLIIKTHIMKTHKDYWKTTDKSLYNLCSIIPSNDLPKFSYIG